MATIKDMTAFVNKEFANLTDPDQAKGMCYTVTSVVQDKFDIPKIIYTNHDNDPNYRYKSLGQHSDHFALMHRGKVLDFTLRQFDPTTPFPFYGSVSEWKSYLEKTWDTAVKHYILDDPDDSVFLED